MKTIKSYKSHLYCKIYNSSKTMGERIITIGKIFRRIIHTNYVINSAIIPASTIFLPFNLQNNKTTMQTRTNTRSTLRLTFLFLLLTAFSFTLRAQTILEPGDIVFNGYITTDDNNVTQDDEISFILLKDIDVNTSLFLTDFGWTDQGSFQFPDACGANTGSYFDGIIQWTSTSVLYCGTQVTINCKRGLTANTGTVSGITSTFNNPNVYLSLSGDGDQVLMFTGTVSNPDFICGISINRDWETSLDSCDFTSARSILPAAIAGLSPAVFPDAQNASYNCSITIGDTLTLQSALTEIVNWNKDTTTVLPIPSAFQLPLACTFSGCALPVPTIIIEPSSIIICEGNTVSIPLAATNATGYQWQQFVGGQWLNTVDTLPFSGSNDSALTITSMPLLLNGANFRCIVTGAAPPADTSLAITLTVQGLPNIVTQTPARAICEGQNCAFSVSATGQGLTYQWQFDNGNGWTNLTNTPPYSNVTNSGLQIAGSPFSVHLTNYRCIVSGTCSPADTSASVYIFVNQLPNIVTEPTGDSICVGENTSFFVEATGYTLQYRWQMNTGSGFTDLLNGAPFSGVTTDSLILTNPSAIYNGAFFRCIVNGVCNPTDTSAAVLLTVGTIPGSLVLVSGDTTPCEGNQVSYEVAPADPTAVYTWSYPGNDVTFTDSLNTALFDFGENAENGSITIQYENFCGISPVNTFPITVGNADFIRDTVVICPGDSAFIHGNWQTAEGDYAETFTNISGCDSSFITRLNFHPAYTIAIQTGICPGDSAFIYGNWQTIPGIYTDSLTTVNGCDSILLTELIQLPVYNEQVTTTICTGDSIFLAGSWQTTAGIYLDSLLSSTGCDSIVNTTLSIVTGDTSSQTLSLCNGDSLFLGGNWQTTAGIYADTLQNINGCDSIVTTTLIILATDSISQSYTICSGDSILLSGSWQTITGIYTDTLQNTNGCDSIIYNNLTVLLTDSIYANIGICTGDSIFLAGSWQTTAGLYTEVYQNQNGCDSIRYTNLQVNSLPVVTLTLPDSAICQPDIPYTLTGEFPTGGNWIGSGVSGNIFNPAALPPGMYTIQYVYTDSNGCNATAADSIVYYICSGIQENEIASIGLYPNPASDYLEIQLPENQTLQQRYEIIDSNGRLLDSGVINTPNNRIDIRTLSDGIYLMKIQIEQEIRTGRFIKIK
jgi:hypothetical protein